MGYKTYEADKYGRITVYPSLSNPIRKKPGIFKVIVKKLIDVVRGKGEKALGEESI